MSKYNCKQFEAAIPGSGGVISTIALRVGCQWHTAKSYIDQHPTLKALFEAEQETNLDIAESLIITNIKIAAKKQQFSIQNGIPEVVSSEDAKWFVSKKGKKRGYGDKVDNFNFDLSQCTNEQLQRIANGEDPLAVIAGASAS